MKKWSIVLILSICLCLLVGCIKSETQTVVNVETSVNSIDTLPNDDAGGVLKNGDLTIVKSDGKFEDDSFEYSFVVKNNSEYELKVISVNCSICDSDGNVLGTDSAYLYATILSGKQGTVKGSINKNDLNGASYIIVDSHYYDTNGDSTFELYTDRENAEQTKLIIPSESNDTVSNSVSVGVVTQPSDETIREQSIDFDYDKVVSNAKDYEGKYVCLKGKILAEKSAGTVMLVLRIDVTPDSFSSNDKIVHVTYVDDYIDSSAYDVGDLVTVYGEFTGIGTFDTAYAKEVEMPKISANIVEIS